MKKWRCTVCGQVFEGDTPPVPCPVCGAGADAFVEVEQAAKTRWRCTVCGQVFDGDAPPVPCPVCGAGADAFEKITEEATPFRHDTDDAFVLVGGGLAALEAARAIRKRNQTASITMLCAENTAPYNRPGLTKQMLADNMSFANLLLEEEAFYADQNIQLKLGAKAELINTTEKQVHLAGGETVPYTKVLLATGANPFNPVKSSPGAVPVQALRWKEDAEKLLELPRGTRVVLVGGGILGLEAAVALYGRGLDVTVVELAPRILPLQTDEEASARLRAKLESLPIRILTGLSVQSAEPGGVLLSNGETIETDYVLASLGVRGEVSLAVSLGLELSRGIVVDEYMHTSHSDIWAAGDCAEFGGQVLAIAGAAAGMGAVAGASMAGDEGVPYRPFVPATSFSLPGGFSLFSVGAAGAAAENGEWAEYQNTRLGIYKRLYYKNGSFAGGVFLGENPAARAVGALGGGAKVKDSLELLT